MPEYSLSKSTFIKGLQCLKALYLYKNRYYLRDPLSPEKQAVFARGWDVGNLARNLFPGGVVIPRPGSASEKRTRLLILNGEPVIYEACFIHDHIVIAIDILIKTESGWKAVEVKSSRIISQTYLYDAFLQYYVISGSGLELDDFSLIHIDPEYLRQGALDLSQLFKSVSVIGLARENTNWVKEQLILMREAVFAEKSPDLRIGTHCFSPYTCEFHGHCWKSVPGFSVFNLNTFTPEEQFTLYHSGFNHPNDELPAGTMLSENQIIQLQCHVEGKSFINRDKIQNFLSEISGSVGFLKILKISPAVPLFENSSPYEAIPFAFCLEKVGFRNGVPETISFMAEPGIDPRQAFNSAIQEAVKGLKCLIVYDPAGVQTSLYQKIKASVDLSDISLIFTDQLYYEPAMAGVEDIFSLASVLTGEALPGEIPFVSETMASVSFAGLVEMVDIAAKKALLVKLEEYCYLQVKALTLLDNFIRGLEAE